MERYDLRSCYLPDLSGLHLRIHQFQTLLAQHLPKLAAHLDHLKVEPLYVSQWFLSFFATTCPLPMLLRIYDVILSEGATETLMRVALSLMQRNEQKLLSFTDFEDAMQFLPSRSIWDCYAQHADDLVSDFVELTCLVSQESLKSLETSFQQTQNLPPALSLKSTAATLLGRFWAGASHASSKSGNLSLTIPGAKTPLRKSSSGQSITSTLNSVGTSASEKSETSTLATELSDDPTSKPENMQSANEVQSASSHANTDRDLHHQIEELLTALNHLQHQHTEMSHELQREREERTEDRTLGQQLLTRLRTQTEMIHELVGDDDATEDDVAAIALMDKAEQRLGGAHSQRFSIIQTKHQLRDAADEWRTKHDAEALRCQELMKQLDEREAEHNTVKEQLRDVRTRVQSSYREKQQLERQVSELRSQQSSSPESPFDTYTPITPSAEFDLKMPPPKAGLREFKLGRNDPVRNSSLSVFSKRSSSLNAAAMLVSETNTANHDAVLLELVNAKTAEAVARQELEETKGKLDALRRILTGPTTSPIVRVPSGESPVGTSPVSGSTSTTPKETAKPVHTPSASTGGFFSGWGRRG